MRLIVLIFILMYVMYLGFATYGTMELGKIITTKIERGIIK